MPWINLTRRHGALPKPVQHAVMTGHGDIAMSVRGMKAGAVDFPTKPFREQDMLDAVGTVIRRDRVRRDAEAIVTSLPERFITLSPREREVMLWSLRASGINRWRIVWA
jgi:FixJ family two-component response regulator